MVVKGDHPIILNNGAAIWLPPTGQGGAFSLAIPDPHNDVDTVQKYPIDTRMTKDERAWRYCRIGDIDGDGQTNNIRRGMALESQAVVNSYTDKLVSESGFNTAGDYKIKIDMTTHVDFLSSEKAVVEGDYVGGNLTIYDTSTGNYWGCRIDENEAEDSDGYVELTLESPLPFTLSSDDILMLEEGLYWKVQHPGNSSNYCAIIGVACNWAAAKGISGGEAVSDGEFIWAQTWGPFQGIIQGNAHGGGEGERMSYFAGAGYPDKDYYPNSNLNHPQPCGWYTANNYKNGSPADFDYNYQSAVFLSIAP
jgi:hypothetical protein